MKNISTSIPKIDGPEKIRGSSLYVDDIKIDNVLFAKTLRSSIAKGRIDSIVVPPLPRGVHFITAKDIPGKNRVKIIFDDMPVFAEHEVRYIGEPIGLLIGADKMEILNVMKQIKITYIETTPRFDFDESAIHYHYQKGCVKEAFDQAKKTITKTYETGYQEQAYIEPQGMIGMFEDNKVVLIGSIQCPYYAKNAVIETLACESESVRIIQSSVGGAFGGKEEFPSLLACQLAVAVQKIKQPIKLIYEREEDMEVTTKRHPSKTTLSASVDGDNRITAIRCHVGIDGGAYVGLSGVVLSRAMIASSGAYTIDNLEVDGDVYITNTVPTGAFRGFGAPQMKFAVEMFIHHVAKELNVDPFSFRMRHLAKQGDRTSTNGTFRDPIIMPAMIDLALKRSDYHEKAKKFASEDSFRGIGMSWFFHGCGFTGSGESKHINALVTLKKNRLNHVFVYVAAVDMGQGAKTVLTKIVAGVLDLPIESVTFDNPDTDFVPDSGPTVASRTTMIVGGLLARAAKKLKESWEEGCDQTVHERYVQPPEIEWDEETFQGDAYPAYSWGVNVVEVRVCKKTYHVDVEHAWSVYDVGKAIDERLVLGQADGGFIQGLAYGTIEVMECEKGKIRQKNMTDYIIPTTSDIPNMETHLIDNPYPLGPYGAKGVGELTLIGAAPAVALAIEMAIKREVTKIPVTPERIMEMIGYEDD